MLTPQGRATIRHIFDNMPEVAWGADVDSHLQQVNTYLQRAVAQAFPLPKSRPRSSVITEATWQVIRLRYGAASMPGVGGGRMASMSASVGSKRLSWWYS